MTLSVFAWVVGISLYVRQDLMKVSGPGLVTCHGRQRRVPHPRVRVSLPWAARGWLVQMHYLKLKLGYKYVKGDIEWDETATIKYPCICFFAGFFAEIGRAHV